MTRPLRDMLATPDEAAVRRTWRTIRDRRDAPPRVAWRAPVAVGAVAALAVVIVELWPRPPAPLAVAGGDVVRGALDAGASGRAIELDDGSRLDLAPQTQLVVRENAGGRVKLELARGRVELAVRPGGPRRWTVDCGVATIDVTGTQFVVDRTPERIAVAVTHGQLRVSSTSLVPPVIYLAAGHTLSIPVTRVALAEIGGAPDTMPTAGSTTTERAAGTSRDRRDQTSGATSTAGTAVSPEPPRNHATTAPAAGSSSEPRNRATTDSRAGVGSSDRGVLAGARTPPPTTIDAGTDPRDAAIVPAAPDWRALAADGDYRGAFAALGNDGIARETAAASTASQLVAIADVARLSGHAAAAIAPLRRAAELDAVAGYSLGRLLLDELRDFAGAATAIEAAIARGLPASLDEPAHARVVEAHARAGHRDAVARWAAAYDQQYPAGAHREEVRRWAHAR